MHRWGSGSSKGRRLRQPSSSTTIISPGSSSRTTWAPTVSSAGVSEATTQPSGSLPSDNGQNNTAWKVYDVTAPIVALEDLPSNLQLGIYASADGKTISIVDDVAEIVFDQASLAAPTKSTDSLGRETLVQGAFRIRNKTSGVTLLDDPGFKVSDNALGSMTPTIQTSLLATTETGVVSKYKITYRAQDAAGNLSSSLERTIYVLSGLLVLKHLV